ncbi:flavin-dependent dehydrogenase [Catalinimonas alkaloidigena]|uniref:NAD(P)/FAD-dependent oxidoreductase n=1 Tax=Catalinimonas alkaloidigena TaxID=1075417 RepID=UPI002406F4F2|nr:NAD(P)/FAD-dependent oxidoreductase [Catalinimonas alkaloidigena]MDF9800123.1 flavin-dependent dehydrogenase [Catalinimonas alkaloidigena]
MNDVTVIGGGLAGLVNAILLARSGLQVQLIEKKHYPFHKVCGEYISNEVLPFLKFHDLYPTALQPVAIRNFMLTAVSGKSSSMSLDLGGFGISRYALDHFLYQKAVDAGVACLSGTAVQEVAYEESHFIITLPHAQQLQSRLVIGAYGKRSRLDKQLNRKFTTQSSPYIGVKYHLHADFPEDMIALHNFRGGYCGISGVEDGKYNMCYLGSRQDLRKYGSIEAMEKAILYENPHLKKLFTESDFLFDKPEVINAVSFAPKLPVENHILMSGDTAGLITPLCGNGMAMAIHSAKLLSALIIQHYKSSHFKQERLEKAYSSAWTKLFAQRLWVGRNVQRLFGSVLVSEVGVGMISNVKPLARKIMRATHGTPF